MIDVPRDTVAYDENDRSSMNLGYRASFMYAAVSVGLGFVLCVLVINIPSVLSTGQRRREQSDSAKATVPQNE